MLKFFYWHLSFYSFTEFYVLKFTRLFSISFTLCIRLHFEDRTVAELVRFCISSASNCPWSESNPPKSVSFLSILVFIQLLYWFKDRFELFEDIFWRCYKYPVKIKKQKNSRIFTRTKIVFSLLQLRMHASASKNSVSQNKLFQPK